MSISAQALRPSPYTIPPPRSHRMAYGSTSAGAACGGPLQQQPQSPYSISYATSSPTHPSGSALAFPGLLPGNSPPSMLPPASTSLHLPGSPVSVQKNAIFSSSVYCLLIKLLLGTIKYYYSIHLHLSFCSPRTR